MIRRLLVAALCFAAGGRFAVSGRAAPAVQAQALQASLDQLFDDAPLTHAIVAARIESLRDGRVLYARNDAKLVMPASNLKIVTMAVAAERLGWDFTYETRLEATGAAAGGVLHGDLVVTGSGDPSIGSSDAGPAELLDEWAAAVRNAGVTEVDGRLIGDDRAFDNEPLGAGWAWDYLAAGYAAPSGALSYNENVAVARVTPGDRPDAPAAIDLGPPGHLLDLDNQVVTGPAGSAVSVDFVRLPGSPHLVARGRVPLGGAPVVRTTAVDSPTRFLLEALRLALASRGVVLHGGVFAIGDLPSGLPPGARRVIATHRSQPLSALIGYAMKVSQNFYGEMIFKTLGRGNGRPGSSESAREAVRQTLASWHVPGEDVVMYDGSGLSRYNYVTADAIVAVLRRVWNDERLRGFFVASLPVGGHDGTLEARMRTAGLDRRVQAKTGSIANVRALSGYLENDNGEKLVFSIIVNNFTAPAADIDAVVERALARVAGAR